jgi:hypothetical protein
MWITNGVPAIQPIECAGRMQDQRTLKTKRYAIQQSYGIEAQLRQQV